MKLIFALIFSISNVYGAELTLYAINSPYPLNWKNPRTLLLSTLRSSINPTAQGRSNHTIGHAYVGFKCDGQSEVISGMTSGKGFTAKNDLFKNRNGLSVILQDNPGHFQNSEESRADIEFFSKTNRMSIMKLIVTNEQCLKAQEWHEEISSRKNQIYGGVGRRPLLGEGTGCTAYTMSFIEYANINYDFFNSIFEQTINIPNELLGGEFGANKVSIGDISRNRQDLALSTDKTLKVTLYDPNRMYFWITKKWNEVKKNGTATELSEYSAKIETMNNTKVLVLIPSDYN